MKRFLSSSIARTIVYVIVYAVIVLITLQVLTCMGNSVSVSVVNAFQVASLIYAALGVALAVGQYYYSKKVGRIQTAINLAEYFKNNILDKYPAVRYVFSKTADTIYKSVKPDSFKAFDADEMKRLFSEGDISKLKNLEKDRDFVDCISVVLSTYYEKNYQNIAEEYKDSAMINDFANKYVFAILNNLEYFAMNFTHGIADESVIYQSIHNSYIEIVEALYYHIAKQNDSVDHRFYSNVIELYQIWKRRSNDTKQRVLNENRRVSKGSIAK